MCVGRLLLCVCVWRFVCIGRFIHVVHFDVDYFGIVPGNKGGSIFCFIQKENKIKKFLVQIARRASPLKVPTFTKFQGPNIEDIFFKVQYLYYTRKNRILKYNIFLALSLMF